MRGRPPPGPGPARKFSETPAGRGGRPAAAALLACCPVPAGFFSPRPHGIFPVFHPAPGMALLPRQVLWWWRLPPNEWVCALLNKERISGSVSRTHARYVSKNNWPQRELAAAPPGSQGNGQDARAQHASGRRCPAAPAARPQAEARCLAALRGGTDLTALMRRQYPRRAVRLHIRRPPGGIGPAPLMRRQYRAAGRGTPPPRGPSSRPTPPPCPCCPPPPRGGARPGRSRRQKPLPL